MDNTLKNRIKAFFQQCLFCECYFLKGENTTYKTVDDILNEYNNTYCDDYFDEKADSFIRNILPRPAASVPMPIEEAPKDGTILLLFCKYGESPGCMDTSDCKYTITLGEWNDDMKRWEFCCDEREIKPTHFNYIYPPEEADKETENDTDKR